MNVGEWCLRERESSQRSSHDRNPFFYSIGSKKRTKSTLVMIFKCSGWQLEGLWVGIKDYGGHRQVSHFHASWPSQIKMGGGATEYRKRKKENVQQQDSILIDFLKSSQHGRQQVRQSRSGWRRAAGQRALGDERGLPGHRGYHLRCRQRSSIPCLWISGPRSSRRRRWGTGSKLRRFGIRASCFQPICPSRILCTRDKGI